jgi:hypothetical protein
MFGMALRAYQRKMQRLAGSVAESHRTLWQAVYDFVGTAEQVTRKQIDERFRNDPPEHVGAVLADLVQSGLLYASGRGSGSAYKHVAADGDSRPAPSDQDSLDELVCLVIYRGRGVTLDDLSRDLPASGHVIEQCVARLMQDGRVVQDVDPRGVAKLRASRYVIPVGQARGWEAAVFDHFSTVAAAIAHKLRLGPGSQARDLVGGSTLGFEIAAGHPCEAEVYGLLQRVRSDVNDLWKRVDAWNALHPVGDDERIKVSFYFGQNVSELDADAEPQHEVEK